MRTELDPKILQEAKDKKIPVCTFGDLKRNPKTGKYSAYETILTNWGEQECAQILDYIFKIDNAGSKKKEAKGRPKVKPKSMRIEKFMVKDLIDKGTLKKVDVNGNKRKYEYLSDHHGLSLVIEI